MSTELETYAYGDGLNRLRVIHLPDDDQPWFVASDVCKALDIEQTSVAVRRALRESEFTQVTMGMISNHIQTSGRGGARAGTKILVVTESGLFGLIMTSRKPEAEKFRYWIRSEVLPAVFHDGAYAMPDSQANEVLTRGYAEEHTATAKDVAFAANTLREYDIHRGRKPNLDLRRGLCYAAMLTPSFMVVGWALDETNLLKRLEQKGATLIVRLVSGGFIREQRLQNRLEDFRSPTDASPDVFRVTYESLGIVHALGHRHKLTAQVEEKFTYQIAQRGMRAIGGAT